MTDYSLKYIQELAYFYGGKCLSKEFKGNNKKLSWMCGKGHSWDAYLSIVQQGGWCPQCIILDKKKEKKQIYLESCQNAAKERGGKCLSDKYIDNETKLLWQCSEGHQWNAAATNVKSKKQWCPICAGNIKLTIEQMKEVAENRGGKCLSDVYTNSTTKLLWECSEGHQWESTPNSVVSSKSWCLHCARTKKLTIELMHKLAEKRGGKCLSDVYVNTNTKLLWECSKGHKWKTRPSYIINSKSWCPYCSKNKIHTIKQMQKIAKERGGKCLSGVYVNSLSNLLWQCSEGHQWETNASVIIHKNTWCPTCAGTIKLSIEDMKEIAKERGGKCLSDIYVNSSTKHLWQCSEGHTWEAKPNCIKNQYQWCPTCAGNIRLTIEDMRELAAKKEGKCLSNVYVNSRTKLKWQCSEGHQWEANPNNIKHNNVWCPVCKKISKSIK